MEIVNFEMDFRDGKLVVRMYFANGNVMEREVAIPMGGPA